jgi:hypothetical protein
MNADKWWDDAVQKLRRVKGLCPLSIEDADAELKKAKRVPLSEKLVDSILNRVVSGQPIKEIESPTMPWVEDELDAEFEEELLQLNRNAGEEDEETAKRLRELREQLLNDDDNA